MFVARVDDGSEPLMLHSGRSIGPGDLRIATGVSATWAAGPRRLTIQCAQFVLVPGGQHDMVGTPRWYFLQH